jgi:gliding motility-associatede transport system auxiliary component
MEIKKSLTGSGARKVLGGANFLIYTAAVLAILVVANVFVNRYFHRRWDLTPGKKYSLSPQTTKIVKELKRDVTIYDFDRTGGAQSHHDLLDNYAADSRHLSVRYIDPDREPSLARQYEVRSYGTIIVASGDRHFQAQSPDEEGVTNALIRLLKGQKTIYFIQGHGERDLEGSDRADYSDIKKELSNENYEVKTLVLLEKNEIPADCAMAVVAGPQKDYLPPEIETLKKFVDGGGRALFLLDAGRNLPNLDKLLADWHVNVQDDLVVDLNPVARLFGTTPDMPLIMSYGTNPIVDPLKRTATLFPITRSFEIAKDSSAGVTADPLCESSQESFGVVGFTPSMRSVTYREGKDIKGPLTVAVAGTVEAGDAGQKKGEGRFVAVGTSLVAANAYLGFQGNRDLVMNMVNWLSAEEDLISIRPKPTENQHLDLNAGQMNRIFYLGVVGLPLLIILTGVGVWWGRR